MNSPQTGTSQVQDGRLPCMHIALLQIVRAINSHTGFPASKCSKCELNAI
jgi:hypothetical protein